MFTFELQFDISSIKKEMFARQLQNILVVANHSFFGMVCSLFSYLNFLLGGKYISQPGNFREEIGRITKTLKHQTGFADSGGKNRHSIQLIPHKMRPINFLRDRER